MALTGTFFVAKKSAADTCFDASTLSSANSRAVWVEGAVCQPQREREILTFWDLKTCTCRRRRRCTSPTALANPTL
jgi:hypothetical protein